MRIWRWRKMLSIYIKKKILRIMDFFFCLFHWVQLLTLNKAVYFRGLFRFFKISFSTLHSICDSLNWTLTHTNTGRRQNEKSEQEPTPFWQQLSLFLTSSPGLKSRTARMSAEVPSYVTMALGRQLWLISATLGVGGARKEQRSQHWLLG